MQDLEHDHQASLGTMQHTLDNTEKALTEHREDYNDQAPEKAIEVEVARTFDPKFASRTRLKVNLSPL